MTRGERIQIPVDAWAVILLAVRLTYKYLAIWIRMVVWSLVFSIPIITIPLVMTSMYRLIEMVITAEDSSKIRVRDELFRGAFLHPRRDLCVLFMDVLACCFILASLVFWWTRTPLTLRALTGMSLSFLVLWWVSQILILPLLAISPSATLRDQLAHLGLMLLVGMRLLLPLAFACTMAIAVSILLLGPLLLFSVPFVAICGLLTYHLVNGLDKDGWKVLQASADRF